MKRWSAFSVSMVLLAAPLSAQWESELDRLFEEWQGVDSPGASVAVIRGGEIVYSAGFGSAQLEYEIPITPSTVFHVASVSKQFTCFAVLLLAERGELSLDDEIQDYLSEVPRFDQPVTIRQLMHHTSGIRDQWELLAMAGWRLDDVITTEHILTMIRHQRELNFAPNSEYLYSNMGYTLLAQIVERVSGRSFPEFTKAEIFDPLGMSRTHFHDDHQMIVPDRAYSYGPGSDGGFQKTVLSYANAGATSLFTTAPDLARWLDNFGHAGVGGEHLIERMQTRGVLTSGDTINYALGVAIGDYRGLRTVSHSGGDAGFRSNVVWFSEPRVGVVVLSNLATLNPGSLTMRVADVVLADAFPEAAAESETPEAAVERTAIQMNPRVLNAYVGRWRVDGRMLDLRRVGSQLMAETAGMPEFELFPESATSYFARALDLQVTFHALDGQPADSLTIEVEGQTLVGTGVDEASLSSATDFVGTYYSEELGTFYSLAIDEGGLSASHRRSGVISLTPNGGDSFLGNQWFFQEVEFSRDSEGRVDGMRVSGGRVRNIRFEKTEW